MPEALPRRAETVVAVPADERVVVWVGLPLLGALAGWLLKLASHWVADLDWGPFRGPFKLIASIDEPYATIGSLVVGLAAGVALAVIAGREQLTVTVTDHAVALARGNGATVRVDRPAVAAVFMDGKNLVLLGSAGEELARETSDLKGDALRIAFVAHAFPWQVDGDPYRHEFQLWVEDMPGLPAGGNVLLKARARALAKRNEDVALLRKELLRLGIVVRDEKRRQYWRQVTPPAIEDR